MDKQATSIPSTLSTTSTTNKTNENDELVASIAFALKTLQLQTRKVLKYQEVSYEWHLQHHENLKKIVGSLNKWVETSSNKNKESILMQEKPNLLNNPNREWMENSMNTNSTPTTTTTISSSNINFHEYVMQFRGNLDSPLLENALLDISTEQFQKLETNSFDLLLPLMERWIKEGARSQRRIFGLVILIEASKKFMKIFSTIENKQNVRKIISTLDSMLEKQDLDLQLDMGDMIKFEEIIKLRNSLAQQ